MAEKQIGVSDLQGHAPHLISAYCQASSMHNLDIRYNIGDVRGLPEILLRPNPTSVYGNLLIKGN